MVDTEARVELHDVIDTEGRATGKSTVVESGRTMDCWRLLLWMDRGEQSTFERFAIVRHDRTDWAANNALEASRRRHPRTVQIEGRGSNGKLVHHRTSGVGMRSRVSSLTARWKRDPDGYGTHSVRDQLTSGQFHRLKTSRRSHASPRTTKVFVIAIDNYWTRNHILIDYVENWTSLNSRLPFAPLVCFAPRHRHHDRHVSLALVYPKLNCLKLRNGLCHRVQPCLAVLNRCAKRSSYFFPSSIRGLSLVRRSAAAHSLAEIYSFASPSYRSFTKPLREMEVIIYAEGESENTNEYISRVFVFICVRGLDFTT